MSGDNEYERMVRETLKRIELEHRRSRQEIADKRGYGRQERIQQD
jgi:hypothetical protein